MQERGYRLGLGLASATAVLKAFFLIPYKAALQHGTYPHVLLSLLFFAALFNSVGALAQYVRARRLAGGRPPGPAGERTSLTVAVTLSLALLAVAGNATLGLAMQGVPAAVTAVLAETQVIFVGLLALVWLGEPMSLRFVAGSLLALAGIALMSGALGGAKGSLAGVLWGLTSALTFALMHVIVRKYVQRLRPLLVNAGRLWVSVFVLALVPGYVAGAAALPTAATLGTAAAAFAGPFLARTCLIYSARYIPAAKSALLGMSTPLFVLALGALLLDEWPGPAQLLGGGTVLLGMGLALRERPA